MLKKVVMVLLMVSTTQTINAQNKRCCGDKGTSCEANFKNKNNKTEQSNYGTGSLKIFNGTYKDAIEVAAKSNKRIFLDAYATWCAPCKALDKKTFTDVKVSNYLNENFIVFKFDVEKGEGIELAKKFKIESYPTLLVIDSQQRVVSQTTGYLNAEDFLKWIINPKNK